MADLQVQTFLMALATFMAARASVPFGDTPPYGLFVGVLDEDASTLKASGTPAAASVLRIYGGSVPIVPTPSVAIQCKTIGLANNDATAHDQAIKLHGALLNSRGDPLRMTPVNGYRINGVLGLQVPALLSRDGNQRAEVFFNFNCSFVAGNFVTA